MPSTGAVKAALVTGGGGFLGGAIARSLNARGIRTGSISRSAYPALEELGIRTFQADLASPRSGERGLRRAIKEMSADTVFHCAALPGVWGRKEDFEDANVAATDAVIGACQSEGVPRLVFTSSPSVVFGGKSHVDAGPDLPYPDRYLAHYPRTKAEAERRVLAAEAPGELATISLRPHLIFGPGDPNLVPRLLAKADAGKLRIVGDGMSEVSLTYVGNAAAAHLAAADALAENPDSPARGRAFFVNNEEPVRLWEWINGLLEATGRKPVKRRVPASLAYGAGATLEAFYRATGRKGLDQEPPITRFVARQLATSHSYDMRPFMEAVEGRYEERTDLAEATRLTAAWAAEAFPASGPGPAPAP